MTRYERVLAAINGKPVDRVPVSVWMHFSQVDQDPRMLAETQVAFNEKYDFDFIKLMPFGLYPVQDWGAQVQFYCRCGEEPIIHKFGIGEEIDYTTLRVIEPYCGVWGKQLELVEYMSRIAPKDTPYIMTIFSPYTTLSKLAGPRLKTDIIRCPEKVHTALEIITETTIRFVEAVMAAGVYGFFFATQSATTKLLDEAQFLEFCRPYDLRVIGCYYQKTPFNVLHVHGDDIMFDIVKDYPCNCLNWHDRHTAPSLNEARNLTDKCFVGGIREVPYFEGLVLKYDSILRVSSTDKICEHVHEAIASIEGRGLMIAPGCVADPHTPEENLFAVRHAVNL